MLTDLAVDDPTDSSVRARIYFALKRMQIPLSFSTYNVQLHMANRRATEQHDREFDRRLVMLRQLELFRELAPDEQQHIASVLRYAPFGAGEVMTKQGNVAHWLYVISAGEVSVRVGVDGHDREVSRLHGPAFVGEMGLLTGEPRAATIVATTDVECYRLDKTAFQHVLDERPELAKRISELLTQRRVELEVVREGLSTEAKARRIAESQVQIFSQIKNFFGLDG
jgi:CRP-like cAMP-binding protein